MREQRLLDGNDLFAVAVRVLERPEFGIGLDLSRGKIYHGLVEVVLLDASRQQSLPWPAVTSPKPPRLMD